MESAEKETAVEKDRKRDKYLRKKYYIGLDSYNAIGKFQGWRCGICGRHQSEFNISLAVDHEHFKIELSGARGQWNAFVRFKDGRQYEAWGKTQKAAKKAILAIAYPMSIRGLLCPGRHGRAGQGCCNRLLGHIDERWWLLASVHYLENPPAKQIFP